MRPRVLLPGGSHSRSFVGDFSAVGFGQHRSIQNNPICEQQLSDTGDNEFHPSAEKVGSIDDLLIEILLRLPVFSLLRFKSVSKHWLSLIKNPSFSLLRNRNPNPDPPSGLFLRQPNQNNSFIYDFLPLDSGKPIKMPPSITTFNSGSGATGHIEILQSCNGLLLCYSKLDMIYVCNPTLNLLRIIPKPVHWTSTGLILSMRLAFDPTISSHYKILYARDMSDGVSSFIHIETYSSETGFWRVCGDRFPLRRFKDFNHAIYWNKSFHWFEIKYPNIRILHFKIDLEHPRFIEVRRPANFDGNANYGCQLFESCGCLLLVNRIRPWPQRLDLYEMKKDYSGWSVKYHVDLYSTMTMESLQTRRRIVPIRACFMVRCMVLGERDEDSFLVLEVPGMLLRYNIVFKTFSKIYDTCLHFCEAVKSSRFEFIASLASV